MSDDEILDEAGEPLPGDGTVSAFEQGRLVGEGGGSGANPFEATSPDHHHFETGRKFGSRNNRSGASSHWQRRKS